jgi:RHS repeat-associated protein
MTVHTGVVAQTYYAIRDHQNTIWAWVNTNGAVVESYDFDVWGRVLSVTDGSGNALGASAIGNRYLFQGREYSWATGLYYFRARWYDPVTGRWLSPDPIGINGGLNQYVFCANNPVNMIDPLGLWGIQFGSFAIGSGDMWMEFDNSSWMEISKGSAATFDGIIPFADPFESAYSDECGNVDSQYKNSQELGAFARDIYGGRVAVRGLAWLGGTRWGRFLKLNDNRWFRIGPGRMPRNGSMPGGPQVPRVSVGPQRPGVSNPHIDLRAPWEVP